MPDGAEPIVGEKFDVFISYAHADKEADSDRSPAQTLAGLLEAEGYSVWWDRQLIGGQDWLRELPTGRAGADPKKQTNAVVLHAIGQLNT
jgi:hypothetical protein